MPVARVIPAKWLVGGHIERVVVHWTGGTYLVSTRDRSHYHAILQDNQARGKTAGVEVVAVRGYHTPDDNDLTSDEDYAAHVSGLNTRSFGLSAACMGEPLGATGAKRCIPGGPYGPWPLTSALWERLAQAAAEVLFAYDLPVTERTVLQHGEVQRVYGAHQSGKWDCCETPWQPGRSHADVCAEFRRKVVFFKGRL